MDSSNGKKHWQANGRRRQDYFEWKNAECEELKTWFQVKIKDPLDVTDMASYYGISMT